MLHTNSMVHCSPSCSSRPFYEFRVGLEMFRATKPCTLCSWVDPTRSMFPNVTQSNIAGWSIQGLPIHTYFTQKLLGPGMLPKTSKTSSNYPFLDTRKGHIHIYVYIFELLPWIHLTDGATSSLTLN